MMWFFIVGLVCYSWKGRGREKEKGRLGGVVANMAPNAVVAIWHPLGLI